MAHSDDLKKSSLGLIRIRNLILLVAIPLNAVVFTSTLLLNYLAGNPDASGGLFENGIGNVSQNFPVLITPINETFIIWSVIYFFEIVSVAYSLLLILRRTSDGPAYRNPPVLSTSFFVATMLANLLNIGWLFAWDRLEFQMSAILLGSLATSLSVSTATIAIRQRAFRDELQEARRNLDIFILNLVVANGRAIYTTWTCVAANLNLAIYLRYVMALSDLQASQIALWVLSIITVLYTFLDVCLLTRYTRTILTPYAVIFWATLGILMNNFDTENPASLMTLALAGFSAFTLIVKIVQYIFGRRVRSKDSKEELGLFDK